MKKLLLTLVFLCANAVYAQTAAPATNTGAVPASASATTAAPAAPETTNYPQPPHDKHENDIPRSTQMGSPPATPGAPGGGRYFPPLPADPKLPTLWVIGDSTVRNGTLGDGVGNMDQWGWGAPLVWYFDAKKINVVNRAFGGTSSRSFYDGFFWKNMQPQIKKGDFVILQFGANDSSAASIPGTGDETKDVAGRGGAAATTMHSFGWYLTQFVNETRAQGATPIICSLTPRKGWTPDGHFVRSNTTHVAWATTVAKTTNTPFVDLYELIARKYESLGAEKVNHLYVPWPSVKNPKGENLHTGWDGAIVNAECVISGLKALKDDPLADYLSDKGKAIAAVDTSKPAPEPVKISAPANPADTAPAVAPAAASTK